MRDFFIEIATEIASALFTRVSAISARNREARKRKHFEAELAKLREAADKAERDARALKQRMDDAGL